MPFEPAFALPRKPSAALHRGAETRPEAVALYVQRTQGRREAEAFIADCFYRAYGADIRHFLPFLMSLRDAGGGIRAALGFRPALHEPLFLEQYLDRPVESLLAENRGEPVPRGAVIEVGNLATTLPGGARWLIAALTAYLKGAGYAWAVFTAVPALCNAFARLGIDLAPLGAADKGRLPAAEQPRWGRYYDQLPVVVAASVQQSYLALTGAYSVPQPLWDRALAEGAAHPRGRG